MDFVSFILVSVLVLLLILYFGYDRPIYPRGPGWVPFVGNAPALRKLSIKLGGMHHALIEFAKQYETNVLGLYLGREYYVVVFSDEYVRKVLVNPEFQARPDNFFIRLRSMGSRKGITMTDGWFWEHQRQFLVRHLRNLGFGRAGMETLMHNELKGLFEKLGEGGPEINLSRYLPKCVLNVLWAIVTGSMFEQGDPRLEELLNFMNARSKAFDMAGGILTQFPWLRYIIPERSGFNLINRLNQQLSAIIKESISQHKSTYKKDITRDFIDAYIHRMFEEKNDTSFTEEQLIMVCLDLFIAGSQTTSNTLDFAFLHMILHPDVKQRVQKEIDNVLVYGELPKMADRMRLPYVEAVLAEVQRVYNVTPVIGPRRVLKDTSLDGFFIPKGATVLMHTDSVHKDPELWDRPEMFMPERFLTVSGEFSPPNHLYSFGHGIRRCPGEALAKNFLFVFFTAIMFNYDVSAVKGGPPPSSAPIPGITLSPRPYKVQLTNRRQLLLNNNF